MAASHKFSQSHISARTSLSADRVAELTKAIGDNTSAMGMSTWHASIRFEGAELGRTNFSVRGVGRFSEMMAFHVSIDNAPAGCTVRSQIDNYKTSQQTVFFIPVTPKDMVGYSAYRKFMINLAEAIKAEDTSAQISISEREGQTV